MKLLYFNLTRTSQNQIHDGMNLHERFKIRHPVFKFIILVLGFLNISSDTFTLIYYKNQLFYQSRLNSPLRIKDSCGFHIEKKVLYKI